MGLVVRSTEIAFLVPLFSFFFHLLLMPSTCDGLAVLCHPHERAALLRFKDGLSDAGMISSWRAGEEEEDCCSWRRVRCDNRTGYVVELNLQHGDHYGISSLRGKIDPSLAALEYLQRLDLSGNDFEGSSIPPFLGSFKRLTYLDLFEANFSGVVPHHFGNLSSLHVLKISRIYKIESNGELFSRLRELRHLKLSFVDLTGENNLLETLNMLPFLENLHLYSYGNDVTLLPLSHVNFSRLTELSIIGSSFMNHCWFSNITSLEYLDPDFSNTHANVCRADFTTKLCCLKSLSLSNLDMNLTRFFTECNRRLNLEILDAPYNHFSGQLPRWLGDYKRLHKLDLFAGGLSGSIPESIGGMTSLTYLDLSINKLTGFIPQSIGALRSLQYLDLSENNMMGHILQSIGGLQSLTYLDLSRNNLTDFIPHYIGELRYLDTLYLAGNNLMGSIPESIGRLQFLEDLMLNGNNLSGPLPSSFGELKSLVHLDLNSNRLQGNLSEEHFVHLGNLNTLWLSSNPLLQVTLSPHWVPPFSLTSLDLGSCKVGPNFPLWLQTQNQLESLNMSHASISDDLPQWIWSFSSHLSSLDLSANNLTGVVPVAPDSFSMPKIILHSNMLQGSLSSFPAVSDMLFLSDNLLSGPININMSGMTKLSLSRNNFTGEIPPSICEAEKLDYLDLSHNLLVGRIPSCSANQNCRIESLHLNNNNLHGTLPAWLRNCTGMYILDIGENNFSGEILAWISDSILGLKVLRLRSNSFYGLIPIKLSNLSSLQVLDLANNNFSGSIPPTFGNFTAMKHPLLGNEMLDFRSIGYYQESIMVSSKGRDQMEPESILKLFTSVDLSGNKLSGDIPAEIGRLVYLRNLNLSHNYLYGCIPDTFAKLSQLESLDLSWNNISGGIPQTLSDLTSLNSFNVSFNNLSGMIPSGKQFDTFTNYSYMGNSKLCGKPLQKVCQSNLSPPISMQSDQKDRNYFLWLCTSIVLGFIMGFWTFLGTLFFKSNWRHAYFQFLDNQCEKFYLLLKFYVEKCKGMSLKR